MFEKTATTHLQNEIHLKSIVTSCRGLDVALSSGGIPIGVITEFCGPPGSGKTQMCRCIVKSPVILTQFLFTLWISIAGLQLSANVQCPSDIGGIDGESVFIDTKRGYSPHRFRDIASARATYFESIYKRKLFNSSPSTQSLLDKFMNGVTLYFVQDYVQLLAVIYTLSGVLAENPRIRLIVIDSFSFLFRQIKNDEGDMILTRLLYETFI